MFKQKDRKDDGKYQWTNHSKDKMGYYRISESLVKRIIRFPKRIEEGIAPKTVAVMQPRIVNGKTKEEIWVMYAEADKTAKKSEQQFLQPKRTIISTWRYPGISPIRGPIPIPDDILMELGNLE